MGRASAIQQFIVNGSFLLSSTGLYSIDRMLSDQKYIYNGLSGFILFVAVFSALYIKDIITEKQEIKHDDDVHVYPLSESEVPSSRTTALSNDI